MRKLAIPERYRTKQALIVFGRIEKRPVCLVEGKKGVVIDENREVAGIQIMWDFIDYGQERGFYVEWDEHY